MAGMRLNLVLLHSLHSSGNKIHASKSNSCFLFAASGTPFDVGLLWRTHDQDMSNNHIKPKAKTSRQGAAKRSRQALPVLSIVYNSKDVRRVCGATAAITWLQPLM